MGSESSSWRSRRRHPEWLLLQTGASLWRQEEWSGCHPLLQRWWWSQRYLVYFNLRTVPRKRCLWFWTYPPKFCSPIADAAKISLVTHSSIGNKVQTHLPRGPREHQEGHICRKDDKSCPLTARLGAWRWKWGDFFDLRWLWLPTSQTDSPRAHATCFDTSEVLCSSSI